MYEPSRLKGDSDSLTGLLLITAQELSTTAQELSTEIYDFLIVSREPERLLSMAKSFPAELRETITEEIGGLEERFYKSEGQNSSPKKSSPKFYGFVSALEIDASNYVNSYNGLNKYPLGFVLSWAEFLTESREIASAYFSSYSLQIREKLLSLNSLPLLEGPTNFDTRSN